ESHRAETPQVMRDERLRAFDDPREIADAELVRFGERRRDHQTGRIAECSQPLANQQKRRARTVRLTQPLGHVEIEAQQVTTLVAHDEHANRCLIDKGWAGPSVRQRSSPVGALAGKKPAKKRNGPSGRRSLTRSTYRQRRGLPSEL